ncbi:MAG: trigger factor [Clostridia bacterium]|nr:trigger factor [Clostridia bacterium]
MSLTKKELTDKNLYELEIAIDHDTFEAAVNRAYKKQVGKFNIPGFRKGKAPRSIIEKMYGKGFFYEDAINDVLPEAFESAIKEAELDVVGRPEFDIKNIDENGAVLTAKVYVKPEVEIKDYKGIKVTRKVEPVTEEEINAEIATVQNRNSREIEVTDRAAENGDVAIIDFEGSVDGVPFEGGKGENYSLKLGSGSFIPGFEEQVVGKNIGDTFDVNVTFPEDYHAKELAGKAAVFKVTIHKLSAVELPALDDDFAKDVSEFDTFDEYKAGLTAKIEKRHETQADSEVDEQISKTLMEKLEADIPECMFEAETENFVRDYDNRLRMQGLDLKTYFQYTGMTLETLREQMRPQAEQQVKLRLALEKIAALEGLEATEEEINGEYENIANSYNMPVDQVKASIDASAIAEDMKVKKALDLVKANAKISKPRKPAAKKAAEDTEATEA